MGGEGTKDAGPANYRRLGPYVLLRTSGAGGMGRIDLALRAQTGGIPSLCVLKRMHAELRSPEQDARFRREASIALQLSHAAIAQTVGIEEIDGELVLLQELVHGVDLRLLCTRVTSAGERLPLPVSLHVASEVARALAYAHAFRDLGIVHRDVTPDNVMLSFSGDVKLIDFGIARSDVDAAVTGAGHIVGRPSYTAPEIWTGAKADRRADIYSLGVVLWQLLTGRRFEDVRAGGVNAPAAPSTHNPEIAPDLDAAVMRALAREPDQRQQNAGELQAALSALMPAGFDARTALTQQLTRHFDVVRERRMLAVDVAQATRLLDVVATRARTPAAPPRPRARPATQSRAATTGDRRRIAITAIAVAAIFAISIGATVHLRAHRRAPVAAGARAIPPAVAVHASAPARLPSAPPLAGRPSATPDDPPARGPQTPARARPPGAITAGRARPPDQKTPRPAPPPDELLRRAQDKFDVGETETALVLARQAASAGARVPAHVLMGKVMMSERRFDEAEHEFAEAVRLDPSDAQAARLLSLVRETRSGTP